MRKAILVFTKVPLAGKTKTRLTEERGGLLSPQEANEFYEAMLLDVIECCLEAAAGLCEVWICFDHEGDESALLDLLQKGLEDSHKITGIFRDQGGSFDNCMQYAADYLLGERPEGRLAEGIVIVGGDLPTLQPDTLRRALDKLESLSSTDQACKVASTAQGEQIGAALVEGACQEGGFSLIGYTHTTPFTFASVFYNLQGATALDRLVDKVQEASIPLGIVETIPDVDIPADFGSLIPVLRAMETASEFDPTLKLAKRTIQMLNYLMLSAITSLPQS